MPQVDWDELSANLRQCQRECIGKIEDYLEAPYGRFSFLACLPTGAGKTGVIATICQKADKRRILVVCSRRAVSSQLRSEIGGRFFVRFGGGKEGLKHVRMLGKSWIEDGVYVTTFQKLTMLSEENLESVAAAFDLVIVDEGHSEPAPVWSRVSRRFNSHRVIITATPYRNDLFQFDIDPERNYVYTFSKADEDGVLRRPDFEQVDESAVVERVLAFIADNAGVRCIVKCKTFANVIEYFRRFEYSGLQTVAVHEQFSTMEIPATYDRVPKNFSEMNWQVAIHQHMLDEGVDVPEAKLLVVSYAVSSGRELVQAVGRVVRVHQDWPALVLDCSRSANEKMWENYLEFDRYIGVVGNWRKFINSLDVSTLLKSYLEEFPEIGYYEGSFKKRFDIQNFDPIDSLRIPLASFCFIGVKENFSIQSACDTLYWRFHKEGELVRRISDQAGFEVIVSVRFDSSRYLRNELFFQPTFEVMLLAMVGGLLAVFDSRSVNYANDSELGTVATVKVERLLNLAAREDRVRTKELSARAVSTATLRAERIAMTGANLELSRGDQRNSAYVPTMLKVDNLDQLNERMSSYYLGVGSGRVSDQKNRNFSLATLRGWLLDIGEALEGDAELRSELIASFAMPINYVPDDLPISVLLDLSGLDSEVDLLVGDDVVSVASDFLQLSEVNGVFEGGGLTLICRFNVEDGRYYFSSEQELLVLDSGRDFLEVINSAPIRALFDGAVSYADGSFYKISLPSERGSSIGDTRLARCLISVPALQVVDSEKGVSIDRRYVNTTEESFDPASMFSMIDGLAYAEVADAASLEILRSEIPRCDLVVCTDMGIEAADFIVSSPSKLCFVHMKHRGTEDPRSSAGAIADVGAQALKNLQHLISKSALLSHGNRALLDQRWPTDAAVPSLAARVRKVGDVDPAAYMQANGLNDSQALIENVLGIVSKRRSSDAFEKEVWIVVGKGFSRSHFLGQMERGLDAAAESLQAFQLLDGWISISADHDVAFKVFVSP